MISRPRYNSFQVKHNYVNDVLLNKSIPLLLKTLCFASSLLFLLFLLFVVVLPWQRVFVEAPPPHRSNRLIPTLLLLPVSHHSGVRRVGPRILRHPADVVRHILTAASEGSVGVRFTSKIYPVEATCFPDATHIETVRRRELGIRRWRNSFIFFFFFSFGSTVCFVCVAGHSP